MGHEHTHGKIDLSIVSHERGLRAVQWSFAILLATGFFQLFIVWISHSVSLFSDTVHNFADAATAVPLGAAFLFARLKPNRRFTYGYGRVEDLAGVMIVLLILASAAVAMTESIHRFFHPVAVEHLAVVAVAALIGFAGNEGVAVLRIRVGKQIGSAALVADGNHARIDGWTSLAVFLGAVGVWLGFPAADPLIGLGISIVILGIVWDSAKAVLIRMLDGVEPEILEEIEHAAHHVEGVKALGEVRARWIGHKVYAEINVAVRSDASLAEAHRIAEEVSHQVMHHVPQLGKATVHVDPENRAGEEHHGHPGRCC